VTRTGHYGFDISVMQKRIHLAPATDCITDSKCSNSDNVKVTLVFGHREDEE